MCIVQSNSMFIWIRMISKINSSPKVDEHLILVPLQFYFGSDSKKNEICKNVCIAYNFNVCNVSA